MRVLILTRIFPNSVEPLWGPFNRQQFNALAELADVEVLAVIPWYPGARAFRRWSAAGRLTSVPAHENIDGREVQHPRYLQVPKLYGAAGALYAGSLLPSVWRRRGKFDVLLGAWAYPDGCAAVMLGGLLKVPAVIKVHGSDLNVVAGLRGPEANLRWALPRARRVVAVSRPLADRAEALGMPRERIDLVPNGVDPTLFKPADRAAARAELGHPGDTRRWLAYVGRLDRPKGIAELLAAFERLGREDLRLVFVGDGSMRGECEAAAARLGGDRLLVVGARPLAEVPRWLAAADALVLPSYNEGTPNVVLEALACGRRVVATRVGGIPDLVTSDLLGELVPPRDLDALTAAISRAADHRADADAVASAGARGSWSESARRLLASLERAIA